MFMRKINKHVYHTAGNPYLPLWEHTPDGEPRVFEDPDNPGKYRIYVYCSHDVKRTGYCGYDTRVWSASVNDLTAWRDDGPVFSHDLNGNRDLLYAPDLVEVKRKHGEKEYYLYPNSCAKGRRPMVAKSDRPDGPFTPINLTGDGSEVLPDSPLGFDPAVWVDTITDENDPDFETGYRAYGFWGFKGSSACELDPNTMYSVRPGTERITQFTPGAKSYGEFCDPEGTTYPYLFSGEQPDGFNFFEAASMRKVGNKYLFIFSGFSGPDYGVSSANGTLRYAYGDTPLGPWKRGGVLVDCRAIVPNKDGTCLEPTFAGGNTHGSIELINDQYYVFYHRNPGERAFARQAMVAPISIEWDEKSVADGGTVTIRGYDPYAESKTWTAEDSQGNRYTGAEVTSEGFHLYGLDPYAYYSAGYACYLSDQTGLQDSYDIWDSHMPITGLKTGNCLGYKYFGFGGLEEGSKGLKPFSGTAPGNHTAFNLFLTPQTTDAFSVQVWIDGPWDNDVWQGRKIGTIEVSANSLQDVTKFSVDVSESVDHLEGKHSIFLVFDGPASGALCDLVGLGFSSVQKELIRPVAPSVSIEVEGHPVDVPQIPIPAQSDNGIVGYELYEITYPLEATRCDIPLVSATPSIPEVSVAVIQGSAENKPARVTCTYRGTTKIYRIVFETAKD